MEEFESIDAPIIENTIPQVVPEGSIYTLKTIQVATTLCGPLVAGYMLSNNFKLFGEPDKARNTWLWTIVLTVLLFGILFALPDKIINKTPTILFPLLYGAVAFYTGKKFQESNINAHIKAGGNKYKFGRSFLVSVICLLVLSIPILGIVGAQIVLSNPAAEIFKSIGYDSIKTYGTIKNEIAYPSGNISVIELDSIANALNQVGYFDEITHKEIMVKKSGNNYEISLIMNKLIKTDTGFVVGMSEGKKQLEPYFPGHKIILQIVIDEDPGTVYKRIE